MSLTLRHSALFVEGKIDVAVDCTTDALILTSYGATVQNIISVNASVVNLILTENQSQVVHPTNVQANVDALTLTTWAAVVQAGTEIAADVVNLTLQAYAADVDLDVSVRADVVNLTLQTFQADVDIDVNVQAALASLALNPYSANINAEINVLAGYDALRLKTLHAMVTVPQSIFHYGDWRDYKGDRTWPNNFKEQANKWGYLNNPRWQLSPQAHESYTGRENEEPQVWNLPGQGYSSGTSKKHIPCGHWHKIPLNPIPYVGDDHWWQQSIDVYDSKVLFVPMIYEDADGNPATGIGFGLYDIFDRQWEYGGLFSEGYPAYGEPNTARRTSNFSCYFGTWINDATPDNEYRRLIVLPDDGEYSYYDLWTMDSPGYTQSNFIDSEIFNVMDAHSSGLIACLTYIVSAGGVSKKALVIDVSENKGVSWKTPYYFPANTNWYDFVGAEVRIDISGVIWVSMADLNANTFSIYKSTDYGDSWSLVHSEAMGTIRPYSLNYSISDEDGKYQYLDMRVYSTVVPKVTTLRLYRSSDYGVTWDYVNLNYVSSPYNHDSEIHTSNGGNIILTNDTALANKFNISDDYGSSWNLITPPSELALYYIDQQSFLEKVGYVECGKSFSITEPSSLYLGFLLSLDNGATWRVITSPFLL